jgi:hypothetical protein
VEHGVTAASTVVLSVGGETLHGKRDRAIHKQIPTNRRISARKNRQDHNGWGHRRQ